MAEKSVLYEPSPGTDLRDTYPELAEEPEFTELYTEEMLFVWLLVNPESPYSIENIPEKTYAERIQLCYNKAFGETYDHSKKKQYLNQNWEPRINHAIKKMSLYDTSLRARSFKMYLESYDVLENMFREAQKKVKESTDENKEKNYTSFISIVEKVTKTIPELSNRIENFGIKIIITEDKQTEIKGKGYFDKSFRRLNQNPNDKNPS